jgi:hypothetical protein
MREQPTSTAQRARRNLRLALAIVAAGTGLATVYSCSLIVDTQSQQCQADSDCAQFGMAKCDTTNGICVASTTTSGSTTSGSTGSASSSSGSSGSPCDVDGGIAGGGCYNDSLSACPLSAENANAQLLNACTTGCVPFDDTTVKGLVDGGLPGLPNPPDGGL